MSTPECMLAVREKMLEYSPDNVVINPVMIAKNGCPLMLPHSVDAFIKTILPLADILTPNIPEAETITGMKITSRYDMEVAAKKIMTMGCRSVVIKGGHIEGNALDVFYDGTAFQYFDTARINTKNTHGTVCTFSSAIAAQLALGENLNHAVALAKTYVTTAIQHALKIGKGHGPTNHFYTLYKYSLKKEGVQ